VPDPPYIRRWDGSTAQGTEVRADELALSLAPCELSFIKIDHQVRLQFLGVEVVIESPFVLTAGGIDHQLDPGERGNLGPLLRLYPDHLCTASVDPDCTLRLSFDRGATIAVPPDPDYEPWQIVGPGSALVVCMPGESGQLAIWS